MGYIRKTLYISILYIFHSNIFSYIFFNFFNFWNHVHVLYIPKPYIQSIMGGRMWKLNIKLKLINPNEFHKKPKWDGKKTKQNKQKSMQGPRTQLIHHLHSEGVSRKLEVEISNQLFVFMYLNQFFLKKLFAV